MLKTIAAVTPILVVTGFLYKLLIGRPMFAFDYNGIMRYGGGTIPAFLAAGAYSSSIAYSMMFRHSKKIIYLAFAFASLFACVLSGSRMPTVCATICIFTIIFASIKNGVLRIIFVFSGVVTITVGLLTVGGDLLARFSSGSSSGRDLIWKSVMIWADRYPWTGVGFGHQHLLISDYVQKLTHTRATHNEYVRLAGELGYIGSTFFIIGIFMMLYFAPVKKGISDTLVTLIVLGTFFLYSYSDNTMSAAYCMLAPIAYALGSGLTTETDQKTE
ncbi:MAG: O-antigen ligase family protein [Methylophilaceae bacterium]